jgi:hypothetical protein
MCCPSFNKQSSTSEKTTEKPARRRSIRFKTTSDVKSLDITQLEISQAKINNQPKASETVSLAYDSEILSQAKDNKNLIRLKYKRKGRSGSTGQIRRLSKSASIKEPCEL